MNTPNHTAPPPPADPPPFASPEIPPPRAKTKLPQQTIVAMIVLTVSAGAIFGMRKLGMRAGIAFGDQTIEYTPPDSERARTYERIMGDLARIQTPLDVALGEFGASPFMLKQTFPPTPGSDMIEPESPEKRAAEEARRRAEERSRQLTEALSKVKLQSIMDGTRPLARINNETVRVGDPVGEFRVKAIGGRSVMLTADGRDFPLTLEVNTQGPKAPPVKMGKPGGKK
ncbi:MAG: hypothetical protein JNK25_02030 [Phycisphaerae bacterium]|nr:hypothetical protein [Phycisphaerae bacterium]